MLTLITDLPYEKIVTLCCPAGLLRFVRLRGRRRAESQEVVRKGGVRHLPADRSVEHGRTRKDDSAGGHGPCHGGGVAAEFGRQARTGPQPAEPLFVREEGDEDAADRSGYGLRREGGPGDGTQGVARGQCAGRFLDPRMGEGRSDGG